MSQSLVKNLIHLVYSTKHRKPWLTDDVRDRLFAYQAGIFQEWESPALVIGGVEDHVHALFSLSKNHALKNIVEEVKKGSSKWIKTNEGTGNKDFHWQGGYAGFSVSQSNLEEVRKYIENQAEHHRKMTFQDELRALFRRHEIEIRRTVRLGLILLLLRPFEVSFVRGSRTQGGASSRQVGTERRPGLICCCPCRGGKREVPRRQQENGANHVPRPRNLHQRRHQAAV